jgi:xanthine dehydrogenase accessory factor
LARECPSLISAELEPLTARPRPKVTGGIAYLPVLPRCRLLIVGGGHVGQAVAALAHQVDFDVWVVDDREKYACRDRFPHAEKILVGDIGSSLKHFDADEHTYCLIVTRGHSHDEEALYHLATKPTRYVGMIGSRRKIRLIFEDLERSGIPASALARVHAPLGIDIGSQTVPEIAVSIIAQLIGHRNKGPEAFPPTR